LFRYYSYYTKIYLDVLAINVELPSVLYPRRVNNYSFYNITNLIFEVQLYARQ
jgi:hypothetical protein